MSKLERCAGCGELGYIKDGLCCLCAPAVEINTTPLSRPKQLANDHWSYIKELLLTHSHTDQEIKVIGFHYKTAFEHGYKHAIEDKSLDE